MRKIFFLALLALTLASNLAPAYADVNPEGCQGDEDDGLCLCTFNDDCQE